MATCADIAGVEDHVPDDTDGVSFLPAVLGNSDQQEEHDFLYWAFYERGGARAIRAGDWKVGHHPFNSQPRLYNLLKELVTKMDGAYAPSERWRFPQINRKD